MELEQLAIEIGRMATAGIELAAIALLIVSAALSTVGFIFQGARRNEWAAAYWEYRANLGRGILLGLELLVAADIIKTVSARLDFESVGVLAVIVLIRTFLSFSLEVEIKGQWPWQGGN